MTNSCSRFARSLIQAPEPFAGFVDGIDPFPDHTFQTELTHRLKDLS